MPTLKSQDAPLDVVRERLAVDMVLQGAAYQGSILAWGPRHNDITAAASAAFHYRASSVLHSSSRPQNLTAELHCLQPHIKAASPDLDLSQHPEIDLYTQERLTNYLSALTATMGDAAPPKEHILILLPLAVSPELIDGIKKKHPNTTIKYHFLDLKVIFAGLPHNVPDGICSSPPI